VCVVCDRDLALHSVFTAALLCSVLAHGGEGGCTSGLLGTASCTELLFPALLWSCTRRALSQLAKLLQSQADRAAAAAQRAVHVPGRRCLVQVVLLLAGQ
jgi:hypothetical protein